MFGCGYDDEGVLIARTLHVFIACGGDCGSHPKSTPNMVLSTNGPSEGCAFAYMSQTFEQGLKNEAANIALNCALLACLLSEAGK